jgi:cytochrome c55X
MKTTLFFVGLLTMQMLSQAATAEVDPARQNELLYFIKHDCGSCHGMTLKGGLGPALLPETLSAKPKDFLVTTIMEGRKNTAMPPWKTMLSKDDAIWITEQLQSGSVLPTELAKNRQTEAEQSGTKQ